MQRRGRSAAKDTCSQPGAVRDCPKSGCHAEREPCAHRLHRPLLAERAAACGDIFSNDCGHQCSGDHHRSEHRPFPAMPQGHGVAQHSGFGSWQPRRMRGSPEWKPDCPRRDVRGTSEGKQTSDLNDGRSPSGNRAQQTHARSV